MPAGFAYALLAYVTWGLFPLYFHQLERVPALDIVLHRSVWLLVCIVVLLAATRRVAWIGPTLRQPRRLALFAFSAVLLAGNWLLYVWAVNHHRVLDASLGYFINPLVNVLLGVVVLGEKLNRAQKSAVALAAAGVLYLAIVAGRPPWIALALAASFGMYGLIRKVVAVDSVPGLATETLLLAPFAVVLLAWNEMQGVAALGHSTALVNTLLVGSGLITAIPLVLFAFGARRIPLSTVGLVQYIGPTLQFLIGVLVFNEAFSVSRGIGFAFIWIALAVYAADGLWRSRKASRMLRS